MNKKRINLILVIIIFLMNVSAIVNAENIQENVEKDQTYRQVYQMYCDGNFLEAIKLGEKSENRDVRSVIGDIYFWGHGVPENIEKAKEHYKYAADEGSSYSMYKLGLILLNENPDNQDWLSYLASACANEDGLAKSCEILYRIALKNDPKNASRVLILAERKYDDSIKKGNLFDMYSMAKQLLVTVDDRYPDINKYMTSYYFTRRIFDARNVLALKYFDTLMQLRHREATFFIGKHYIDTGGIKNTEKGIAILQDLANRNDKYAAYELSYINYHECSFDESKLIGRKEGETFARYYLRRAAEMGHELSIVKNIMLEKDKPIEVRRKEVREACDKGYKRICKIYEDKYYDLEYGDKYDYKPLLDIRVTYEDGKIIYILNGIQY